MKFLSKNNMINLDDVRSNMREQERQRLLAKHKYKIFQSTDGRWRTDLPDETKKRKVRTIAKSSLEKLEDAIVEWYAEQEDEQYIVVNTKDTVDSLRKLFPKWLVYKQAHTNSATYIKRLISDWNRLYVYYIEAIIRICLYGWCGYIAKEPDGRNESQYEAVCKKTEAKE